MFGISPNEAVDLALKRSSKAQDSRGRKLRKDAQIILGGIVSYPTPISKLHPNDPDFKLWLKLTHKFLLNEYGDAYVSCIFHSDEFSPHLHYYCLPDLNENQRMNIGQIHPGVLARDKVGGKDGKKKVRAYKEAMREFQDRYYDQVGKPCGLTREGAKKRRLSRAEWKAEQVAAERLASSLKLIDFAKDASLKIKAEKESLVAKEQKLEALTKSATVAAKKARVEREELISLKSEKVSVVSI